MSVGGSKSGLLVGSEFFDLSSRAAGPKRVGRNNRFFQNNRSCRDEGSLSDDRPAQNRGSDSDQRSVPDGRRMHDRPVSQCDAIADQARRVGFNVQDRPILNVTFFADFDPLLVAAQDTAVPDGTVSF